MVCVDKNKVVVVNDDPVQLRYISRILEMDEYSVISCNGVEEALAKMTADNYPDIIITDLHMPEIDGWRFCRLLKSSEFKKLNDIPILIVSATYEGPFPQQLTTDLGADGFLSAPFEPRVLKNRLKAILQGKDFHHTPRVLVIDDSPTTLRMLNEVFVDYGYKVETANTASEGEHKFEIFKPNVVILDYHLPDRKGDSLLGTFKCPESIAVVIMMTVDPSPELATYFMKMGADAYVRKPFDPAYLITLCEMTGRQWSLLRIEKILKEKTRELVLSEGRFDLLFEVVPDAVFIYDEKGNILHINESGVRLLGYSRTELLGSHISAIIMGKSSNHFESDISETLLKKCNRFETKYQTRTGQTIHVEICEKPIHYKGKKAILCIFRDITERRHLEEQLQICQRMDSLGTLTGGIAHDFNNLLVGIMGYLDLLISVDNDGLSASQKEYIENALQSCNRAADLIKQFQSLSKGSVIEKTSIDLYEIANEVFNLLKKITDRLITKQIDFGPGEFCIRANVSELHQAFLNLGTNAIHAIEEKGITSHDYIRIRAKDYTVTGKDRTGLPEGEYIHIFFEDSGIGMPEHVKKKAFEPLFTTKVKGSKKGQGLGLTMVYNIITRNHDGYISIESYEGKGTTFHIYLPKASPCDQSKSKEVIGIVGGKEKILVIEDDDMVKNVAEGILTRFGYSVILAEDGKRGLEQYLLHRNDIDLIILDLTMPEMSGQAVLNEIIQINPNAKVIISTGHSEDETRRGILSKAKGFVLKPFSTKELARTVRTVLDV